MSKYSQTSEFILEGRFLGFAAEDGYKLKLLRISTSTGEYRIKLPKELRPRLYYSLTPGEWIQVSGYQKCHLLKGTTKLKAYHVVPALPTAVDPSLVEQRPLPTPRLQSVVSPPVSPTPQHQANSQANSNAKKATILVCQKSDCCKRGGSAVMRALQASLDERGLAEEVVIKGTGCMKRCKAGPNVIMPDKTRYSQIRPEAIPDLLEKHFPEELPDDVEIAS
ncbi:MAG: (2Fe-2S) ferredoxin domain-containing protein [Synechococcales cyanobacterium C42_A2020_086]|jgi:(2Fe-2S) ferredoxin|nr:(2Fe-2S) ferredoxin domain-containing protein [Synechococcales cyanobacterium C42_A2020_086]